MSVMYCLSSVLIDKSMPYSWYENNALWIYKYMSLSYVSSTATVYGQGVYFAVNSALSVSDTYSPPNADGHKFIFMAKVLTGDHTIGKHEMKAAPLKDNSPSQGIPLRYDSVVDQVPSPTLFVIFNDTQAYPEYLVTCQKIYRWSVTQIVSRFNECLWPVSRQGVALHLHIYMNTFCFLFHIVLVNVFCLLLTCLELASLVFPFLYFIFLLKFCFTFTDKITVLLIMCRLNTKMNVNEMLASRRRCTGSLMYWGKKSMYKATAAAS